MKKALRLLALFITGTVSVQPQAALAQALIDSAVSGMIGSNSELSNATKAPPPPSMIMNNLQRQGFTDISELAPTPIGSPMHATATSPAGIQVDLIIDPVTGKLLAATPR